MTPRMSIIGATVLALALGTGCGSSAKHATRAIKVAEPAPPAGPFLLAEFATGVGLVTENAAAPVWLEPGAVAAPDGSAVFAVRRDAAGTADHLVQIDRRTGAVTSTWPLPTRGLSVNAVAPEGRWVALTTRHPGYGDQGTGPTKVVVFDTSAGAVTHATEYKADLQPEAFSVDGSSLFALHYLGDHYRVQTIDPAAGTRYDTSDRDKTLPPEDMHGVAVHGLMSTDRSLLATLYRNPGDDKEPAFVHVLNLRTGWSYCADLPAPFGTGPASSDALELTPTGTLLVAANSAERLAEIRIDDVKAFSVAPVKVTYRNGTIAPPSAVFTAMPGFEYLLGDVPG